MPKTPKSKGKGLTKKVGPFPAYFWVIAGGLIIVLYYYYRHRRASGNQIASSLNQQVIPSGVIVPHQGTVTDQNQNPIVPAQGTTDQMGSTIGTGLDTTTTPVTYPYDYVTNTDLQSGLNNLNDQVAADIAAITFPAPTTTVIMQPPQVQEHTTKTKVAAKKALPPTPTKYYTYKKNVPLRAGQTLHFAKNKGYYAA